MCELATHLIVDKAVAKNRILQWLHLTDLPPKVQWPAFKVVNITWMQAAFASKDKPLPPTDEHQFQYIPVPPQQNNHPPPPTHPLGASAPTKRRSLVNYGNRWDGNRIKRKKVQWNQMEESPGFAFEEAARTIRPAFTYTPPDEGGAGASEGGAGDPTAFAKGTRQQNKHLDATFARNPWLRPTIGGKQSWAERNRRNFACQMPQGGTNHNERVTSVLFRLAEAYKICEDTWRHYAYKKAAMALQHHHCAVISRCVCVCCVCVCVCVYVCL